MNSPAMLHKEQGDQSSLSHETKLAFEKACSYIAPSWPLDKMIAVNPLWELRHLSYESAAAKISALSNIRTVAPAEFFKNTNTGASIDPTSQAEGGNNEYIQASRASKQGTLSHWLNISDLIDQGRDKHHMSWHEEIIHQISQFCADSFRDDTFCSSDTPEGLLFSHWLKRTRSDLGIPIIMSASGLRQEFHALPLDRNELLQQAAAELGLNACAAENYAHALLLDINGWASWLAYLRWQARLQGDDSSLMSDLLAIRLSWELVLWRYTRTNTSTEFRRVQSIWQRQIAVPEAMANLHKVAQQGPWRSLKGAELTFQQELGQQLAKHAGASKCSSENTAAPLMQAVFCIDVRSEVIRRNLESQHSRIQTFGFAGFFGLPIQYINADSGFARPQLPGLLPPALSLRSKNKPEMAARNRARVSWSNTAESPAAMFSLVETSGPVYLWKLLRDSFFPGATTDPVSDIADLEQFDLCKDKQPLSLAERVELIAGVLEAMSLVEGFAPTVLLVGHGSDAPNNPHAASLNCGACGGQSGQFNSQLLASLLNDADIRDGLAQCGIHIPQSTRFIATLHETVTDELRVLDGADMSSDVTTWLRQASTGARKERAAALGVEFKSDSELENILHKRARDWSEVRPEWGLAGNAAFIVAPRDCTRDVDLQGRAFLHDYNWQRDSNYSVLELIMTAPMIVTHWINMQYNASVIDNDRYGSGNKVLHNVVGGNIGVFEGNGGDLRIGLPLQSVHNGKQWMHQPLRLSVYIAAPQEAISEIYRRHEMVRQLVDNNWLYLFSLDEQGNSSQLYRDHWGSVECKA